MKINFFHENIANPQINLTKIRAWINAVVKNLGKSIGNINYIFCDDTYLLNINRQYLQHDYFTDIITFDYSENEKISGDIFISIDTVDKNAKEYDTQSTELYRVIIHGILHLCGFKDKTTNESNEMRKQEDFCLNLLECQGIV